MVESIYVPLFRSQEIFTVGKKHIFNTGLQNDRAHGTLLTSAIPSPATISTEEGISETAFQLLNIHSRVTHINMNTMFSIFFVVTLCLQDELL